MFNIFTNLILVGCSNDFGLNNTPVDPSVEDLTEATNECECPDNSAEITALQEELRGLQDRVIELKAHAEELSIADAEIEDRIEAIESEPDPEPAASSLVVSEFTVDCVADREPGAPTEFLRGYPLFWEGEVTSYYGCLVANIDITDRPYSMEISWLTDNTLTHPSESDYRTSSGNDLRYSPNNFGVMDMNMGTYITSTGDVYAGVTPLQTDWSAAPEELSSKAIPVRVVIIHDRPYTLPAYAP